MTTMLWLPGVIFAKALVIFYPGIFAFWFSVHNNIERLRSVGPRAFYGVAAAAWIVTAGPLLYFRRAIFARSVPVPAYMTSALAGFGILAFIAGVLVLAQAFKQISFETLIGMPEVEPQKKRQPILDSGIYSRTRNPVYVAHWLLVLSAAAVTNFTANWALFVLDCAVLPLLIRAEERELLARYGSAFADYMRRVPRFFPQLR